MTYRHGGHDIGRLPLVAVIIPVRAAPIVTAAIILPVQAARIVSTAVVAYITTMVVSTAPIVSLPVSVASRAICNVCSRLCVWIGGRISRLCLVVTVSVHILSLIVVHILLLIGVHGGDASVLQMPLLRAAPCIRCKSMFKQLHMNIPSIYLPVLQAQLRSPSILQLSNQNISRAFLRKRVHNIRNVLALHHHGDGDPTALF